MHPVLKTSLSALTLAMLPVWQASADTFDYPEFVPSQSDFGGVGLMQMPSGRVTKEGELSVGGTFNDEYHHYTVSLQLLPWLETTIRYTLVQDLLYSGDPNFSGDTKYTDKGIDFKVRLLEESYWLPETSIGVRDFGGTGLFDGEFIAASKHVGPFDFTLGVGWGYIGNSGNLTGDKSQAVDCDRNTGFKGKGGSIDFDRWFTGCSAVFGGVEYQSPWAPLRLKVEYDGNDYTSDFPVNRPNGIDMSQDSKFNYGALYRLGQWGDIRLSYERGTTWTLGFTLNTNFNDMKAMWQDEPLPTYEANKRTSQSASELTPAQWEQLAQDLHQIAGYKDPALYADDSSITVVASQSKYRDREEAQRRAGTLLANQGPTVDTYRIIETNNSQPVTETHIDSDKFADVADYRGFNTHMADATTEVETHSPRGKLYAKSHKDWDVSVSPTLQQSFGGSEDFYLFNIGISAGANYWFSDHVELGGSLYLNIYDNYDKFLYEVPPDGTDLKRVRTLVRQYINDNPIRMNNLQLTWMDKLADNWYAQAYGGYLEMMFGGVGSEILYRPLGSNWAFGIDANYVVQRDPESQFGFFTEEVQFDPLTGRNYRVQTGALTGHATAYYQPDWSWLPNTLLKVSAGRYLTEDIGVTIDFSKQFDSGVIAGAFVAKTDLSAEEFGEGSFNKGFYISIPFDVMTVKPSTNRATISWLPLSRDGGQMLNRKYQLYSVTDARSPWYGRKALN
ncbi:YjbH domain-containing protein [Photobacterium aphoticum]|uniref:WbfB n=1 Tax=Photobacterium aphoticum TaxID=754436 RepID=A0A0J1GH50_9GAMM|nr:YjbH domain-containing protein [Photobacterium aphoticum]KLU98885.1 WbfB [Photobacterium aphoticum]PSU56672.1 YjbH domain-containing protein [Photobacterium aphoticum]GHA39032.1 WbfB protein [Photobacterium aphoticum]